MNAQRIVRVEIPELLQGVLLGKKAVARGEMRRTLYLTLCALCHLNYLVIESH